MSIWSPVTAADDDRPTKATWIGHLVDDNQILK